MKMEPDEVDFEILKIVVEKSKEDGPACRMIDCYRDLIGKPYKGTFLWKRVHLLIKEKYLESRKIGPGRIRIFPTTKAKRLVSGANNNIRGRK